MRVPSRGYDGVAIAVLAGVRIFFAVILVGCHFEHGISSGSEPDGGAGGSGSPPSTRTCKYPRADLRLCVEFGDGAFDPIVHDSSTSALDLPATDVQQQMRGSDPAAAVDLRSALRVPETHLLDIPAPISIEMWVSPAWNQTWPLVYNDRQYSMWLDSEGRLECKLGGASITSDAQVTTRAWNHVACVYAAGVVYAYVNASSVKCNGTSTTIPTDGFLGTTIAPGFVGAIDDVRIYAGALSGTEICQHADKTCALTCVPD